MPRMRFALVAAALVALSLTSSAIARADDRPTKQTTDAARAQAIARQAASSRAAAQAYQATIAQLNAKLAFLGAEQDAAAAQITSLTINIAQAEAALAAATAELDDVRGQLTTLQAQLAEQTAKLSAQEKAYGEHLRVTYRSSQVSVIEMLLSAKSLTQFADRLQLMLMVDRRDVQLADEIRISRAQTEKSRSDVAAREAEAAGLQTKIADQRTRLIDQRALYENVIAQANVAIAAQQVAKADAIAGSQQAALSAAVADAAAVQLTQELQKAEAAYTALAADLASKSGLATFVGTRLARTPVDGGTIASPFGMRDGGLHNGLDIAAPMYTPVHAAADGVVVTVGHPYIASGDTAEVVIIAHGNNLSTLYGHLDDLVMLPPVRLGQTVKAGDLIGYIGMSGRTTGPHLHFMTILNGGAVDPAPFISR